MELKSKGYGDRIDAEAQDAVRADLRTAFQQSAGEVSEIHNSLIDRALNIAVRTADDEWSHDTLVDEAISYLSVFHSDLGGALAILDQLSP